MKNKEINIKSEQLKQLIAKALGETGCEWLKAQDFQSIGAYSLEEIYELLGAIDRGDPEAICGELGDLYYHLLVYAQMAEQRGWFDLEDMAGSALAKQAARGTVCTDEPPLSAEAAQANWQANKLREPAESLRNDLLADFPQATPALVASQVLQERAAQAGLDWDSIEPIFAVLQDEIRELQAEIPEGGVTSNRAGLLDELGDVLFTCVNLARHLGVSAEQALWHGNRKFHRRFLSVRDQAEAAGGAIADHDWDTLMVYWQKSKEAEK